MNGGKNPNEKEDLSHEPPKELIQRIKEKERKITQVLQDVASSM